MNALIKVDEDEIRGYQNVPVSLAAKYLGISELCVRCGIKEGRLPIGAAIQGSGTRRMRYHISPWRLIRYQRGTVEDEAATDEPTGW